jgi:hypothetical protein
MMIPEEISLIVTSDTSQGASNVSQDGSSFEIQLEDPIHIPSEAINVTTCIEEATIWWTVPNIIEGQNDKFYVFGDRADGSPAQLFTVQIPQGLYDLTGLNNTIQLLLENAGAKIIDGTNTKPLIQIGSDSATQKILIRYNYPNVYIDFSPSNSLRDILGYDQTQVGPYSNAPVNKLAPNVAQFNTVNYFLIASDLVSKGIRFNNRYNQVVSQVLINVSPGSQIVSTPFNPPRVSSQELAGVKRSILRFRLSDDKLRPVNTNGENFTARVVIRYLRPFVVEKTRN